MLISNNYKHMMNNTDLCEKHNTNICNKTHNLNLYSNKINNKNKNCFYCGSNQHLCRDCPKEKRDSTNYKLQIGKWAEQYVSNYVCPNCSDNSLKFLGNHTPSLDIICTSCGHMIEVKSKCLSINKLPDDIWMYHGNFNFYKKRVNQGLTFVVVIYAVNRLTKAFNVRRVLYIENNVIKENKKINVIKNKDGKNSKIFIPNINKLKKWNIMENTIKSH